jgi:hypothetical protein
MMRDGGRPSSRAGCAVFICRGSLLLQAAELQPTAERLCFALLGGLDALGGDAQPHGVVALSLDNGPSGQTAHPPLLAEEFGDFLFLNGSRE